MQSRSHALCSFAEALGHLTLQPTTANHGPGNAIGRYPEPFAPVPDIDPKNTNYFSDFYCPGIPTISTHSQTHDEWTKAVNQNHALLRQVQPGNPEPLPRQKPGTCGEAVKPPMRRMQMSSSGSPGVQPPLDAFEAGFSATTHFTSGAVPLYERPVFMRPYCPPVATGAPQTGGASALPWQRQRPPGSFGQPGSPGSTASTATIARPGFYPSPYAALPSAPPGEGRVSSPGGGARPQQDSWQQHSRPPPLAGAYPQTTPPVHHDQYAGAQQRPSAPGDATMSAAHHAGHEQHHAPAHNGQAWAGQAPAHGSHEHMAGAYSAARPAPHTPHLYPGQAAAGSGAQAGRYPSAYPTQGGTRPDRPGPRLYPPAT